MWHKFLLIELNDIRDYVDPGSEVEEGERIVGEMTEDQKKLYTLSQKLEKSMAENLIKGRFSTKDSERKEAMEKALELKEKSETVREIMWISIKDEFHLWGESIGIRSGFKVVKMNSKPPTLSDFLRGL